MSSVLLRRRSALLCAAVVALGACTTSTEASNAGPAPEEAEVAAPLPTIGLGSDFSRIDAGVGSEARDPEAVESIVMIGDSITVASTEELEQQFDRRGFDDVTIVAQQGKRIGESFGDNASGATIADFVADDHDGAPGERLWIVALGTNDISQYQDSGEIADVIDTVLESVPADAPLIWVDTYFAGRPDDTADVNSAIERAIVSRGNATIGPWSVHAPADGVISQDGVHPTEQGTALFADVVGSTATDFLRR